MSSREDERSMLRDVAIELSSSTGSPDSPLEAVRASMQQRADQAARMGAEAERAQSDSSAVVFQPLSQSSSPSTAIDVSPPTTAAAAALVTPVKAPLSLGNALARWIPKRVLGISYLALSAIIFSVMALFVSMLSKKLPSFQIVWARCILQFVCGYLSCRFYGIDWLGPPAKRKWLTIRGAVGVVAFSLYYFAIANLTLADATTIFFTAPLYTGILGFIFLGEKVHRADVALTLASVVGVVLVVRPAAIFGSSSSAEGANYTAADGDSDSGSTTNANSLHAWGLLAAIGGSLVSAFVYIAIRKVGPGVNPLVLVCYMGFVGMFMAPFGALLQTFLWPTFTGWLLIAAVGFLSFTGQILFNAGVQMEKAGPASMIRNLDVAMSFLWQMTIEGISPNVWSVVGAIVISASVVTMGVRKWRADERAEQSKLLTNSGAVPAADKLVRVASSTEEDLQLKLESQMEQDQQAAFELSLEHSDVDLQQPTLARWHSGASF